MTITFPFSYAVVFDTLWLCLSYWIEFLEKCLLWVALALCILKLTCPRWSKSWFKTHNLLSSSEALQRDFRTRGLSSERSSGHFDYTGEYSTNSWESIAKEEGGSSQLQNPRVQFLIEDIKAKWLQRCRRKIRLLACAYHRSEDFHTLHYQNRRQLLKKCQQNTRSTKTRNNFPVAVVIWATGKTPLVRMSKSTPLAISSESSVAYWTRSRWTSSAQTDSRFSRTGSQRLLPVVVPDFAVRSIGRRTSRIST